MQDVNCPYCNKELDINHDDGYGYSEDEFHQQDCGHCGMTFVYLTSISVDHAVYKADCLNGSEHEFKLQKVYPERYAKMECVNCGEEREPTREENPHLLSNVQNVQASVATEDHSSNVDDQTKNSIS